MMDSIPAELRNTKLEIDCHATLVGALVPTNRFLYQISYKVKKVETTNKKKEETSPRA
jgi:hypothetical protein